MHIRTPILSLLSLGVCLNAAPSHVSARDGDGDEESRKNARGSGVFVLGNDSEVNAVLAYQLSGRELRYTGTFATAGKGGAAGNQGGLAKVCL